MREKLSTSHKASQSIHNRAPPHAATLVPVDSVHAHAVFDAVQVGVHVLLAARRQGERYARVGEGARASRQFW